MVYLTGARRVAPVEAVPLARVGRARTVRDRGRRARRLLDARRIPRAVGLPRGLSRVHRSRRDVRDARGSRARHRRHRRASSTHRRRNSRARRTRSREVSGERARLPRVARVADRAARAGGEVVRHYFGHLEEVREKSPGDWVSEADLASEQAIRELLDAASPGLPVFGEEAGGDDFDTGWLVDPLDGTSNFLHGFDAVGVSVGLIADGVPVVGVVHAPLLDRTFCAPGRGRVPRRAADAREHAAARAGDRGDRFPVPAQGTAAAATSARLPAGAARLRGPPPGRRGEPRPVLDRRGRVRRLLRAPASARGTWPRAAIIVREAGGVVTDWAGDDRAWLRSGNIVGRTARGPRRAARNRRSRPGKSAESRAFGSHPRKSFDGPIGSWSDKTLECSASEKVRRA